MLGPRGERGSGQWAEGEEGSFGGVVGVRD